MADWTNLAVNFMRGARVRFLNVSAQGKSRRDVP